MFDQIKSIFVHATGCCMLPVILKCIIAFELLFSVLKIKILKCFCLLSIGGLFISQKFSKSSQYLTQKEKIRFDEKYDAC